MKVKQLEVTGTIVNDDGTEETVVFFSTTNDSTNLLDFWYDFSNVDNMQMHVALKDGGVGWRWGKPQEN